MAYLKNKENNPLVTIYITNYNYGQFIRKSILSALNQTYKNFELIIIDDGSTDNSKNIINKFSSLKNVKIVFQKNKGLNTSNNIAYGLSKGEFITRLDADDWLDENYLQIMVSKIKKNPDIGLIFSNYYLVDKKGNIVEQFFRHNFKSVKLLDQPAHGACSFIRKKCLQEIGGYDEQFRCQDGVDLWIRFIQKYKVMNVNLPLFYYRQHGKSLTKNFSKIISTKEEIFKKNALLNSKKNLKVLAVIPIRGNTTENSTIAFHKILNKPIIKWTLDEVVKSEKISKIIVSSPDKNILKFVNKFYKNKIIPMKRDKNLAKINVSVKETLKSAYNFLKRKKFVADAILSVNIVHPFLTSTNFDSAINIMQVFQTDEVIGVKKENEKFFQHNGRGLQPVQKSDNLRLEREEVYRQIGSIHLIKFNKMQDLRKKNKVGHLIINEISSFKIKNEIDLKLAQVMAKELKNEQANKKNS